MIKTSFEYKKFKFSGGETQIRISELDDIFPYCITWQYENDSELFEIALLVNAIRNINTSNIINLFITYLPYARQDRVCYPGEAFSLKVLANFINSLKFNIVELLDPHNIKVTTKLIKNFYLKKTYLNKLKKMIPENTLLIMPDKGAAKKAHIYEYYLGFKYAICDKVRNPDNGYITSYSVPKVDFSKYNCLLVVDDICDGGATFNILSDNIDHPNKWLFVTHGIFSKGTKELLTKYNKIITTNSTAQSMMAENVEILEVF